MATTEVGKSPNDILAEQIARELVKEGLIPENRKTDFETKLKNRGVSQDDWYLWIDIATVPEKTEEKDHE